MVSRAKNLHCLVSDSVKLRPTREGRLSAHSFVVKDCVAIAGHTSSFGHPTWRDTHEPEAQTAPVVARLLESGARMNGLAILDQLTYSLEGDIGEGTPPKNTLYPNRLAGGSSSGSASAVAGGFADFAIGTDTGGSVRVPAAACGIFGIRPTHGAIDSNGVLSLAHSFDTVGLFARNATVLQRAFETASPKPRSKPAKVREVLLPTDVLSLVDSNTAQSVRSAAASIAAAAGVRVREIQFGRFVSEDARDLFARMLDREIWGHHGDWVRTHNSHLATEVRQRLAHCRELHEAPPAQLRKDESARRAYTAAFDRIARGGRVIVLPVLSGLSPLRSSAPAERTEFREGTFRLTAPSSMTGAPQVVIPVHHGASGNTYGVGVLGARGSDRMLLDLAVRTVKEAPVLRT